MRRILDCDRALKVSRNFWQIQIVSSAIYLEFRRCYTTSNNSGLWVLASIRDCGRWASTTCLSSIMSPKTTRLHSQYWKHFFHPNEVVESGNVEAF